MAKRMKANTKITLIVDRKAPSAIFLDDQSVAESLDYATAEEKAFAAFEADHDEGFLWEDLTKLGWLPAQISREIERLTTKAFRRPKCMYAQLASFVAFA